MKSNSNIPNLNTLEVQEGKLGRPFRNTAVSKVPDTDKWINSELKSHWLHIFKYLDDGSNFAIEIDHCGTIIKVIKNYEF